MTISSEQGRQSYQGAGTTGPFTVPFKFFDASDLKVVKQSADGTDATLTLNVDYTVTGAGSDLGGTVTTTVAVESGETLSIILDPPRTQLTDYVSNDAFPAESHERALDRLTQQNIRVRDMVERALRLPDGDFSVLPELPGAAARAGMFLRFDQNGDPEMATGIDQSQTLSQSVIGSFLYPRTSAEAAAGVTPTNYAYAPGDEAGFGEAARYTLNADGTTDDTANLEAITRSNWNFQLGPHSYFIDDGSGRGWVVHEDLIRIEGYNWKTTLTNNTANQSVINMGDAAENERKAGNAVGWVTFKDVPQPDSTGSDNNEGVLHFIAQDHPLAYFNRFINCGLGLRFGRARTAEGGDGTSTPTGGDGTRFGLALGNYFEDPRTMTLEVMDPGSYGNQFIATRIANPNNSGNGENASTQSHAIRLNGNYNAVIGLTALDGMADLASYQSGVGHVVIGAVGTGQIQGLQVTNTTFTDGTPSPKYSVALGWTIGNTIDGVTSYGARMSECTDFIFANSIIYHESINTSVAYGVHLLDNIGGSANDADPAYCVIGPIITANTRGSAGIGHNELTGTYHHIDMIVHGAQFGDYAFHLDDESANCTFDVSVDRAAANPANNCARIEGVGHIGRLIGQKIVVNGSNHILDIVQEAGTSEAITINCSDSILRIRAVGPITVAGDRNDLTVNSSLASGTSLTFTSTANNNVVRGVRDVNMTDNGTGNTSTDFVLY